MGWTIPYDMPHRQDLIKERVESREWTAPNGHNRKLVALKHCYIGGRFKGTLYVVWESTTTQTDGAVDIDRFIEVDLLEYFQGQSSWGYKDMDCCSGPNQTMCPPSYLALCPPHENEHNTWCKDFHERSRQYWKDRNLKMKERKALQY